MSQTQSSSRRWRTRTGLLPLDNRNRKARGDVFQIPYELHQQLQKVMLRIGWVSIQLAVLQAAILPPPWADPSVNPCATQPGGWLMLYWPTDGQCYRIFQKGHPCPKSMELSPGATEAECRCPPGQVQIDQDSPCYKIHSMGPCPKGQYLAPLGDDARGRWGTCNPVPDCSQTGDLFWPASGQCYTEFTRGPCPVGQLLIRHNSTGLADCGCDFRGLLAQYYWPISKTCHQYYTKGPCLEKGSLFLPGPKCGCHSGLANYHAKTEQCYELGISGPCKTGQTFTGKTGCACKVNHVPWYDGHCYRAYTRGPCQADELVWPNGTCQSLPCPRGKLYFPENDACHRVGVPGPCTQGQLVLFEQSVRAAVEGISYRGMCGCPNNNKCHQQAEEEEAIARTSQPEQQETARIEYSTATLCDEINGTTICHKLYTQGPCQQGEWLVPNRQNRARRSQKKLIPSSVHVYMGHRFSSMLPEPMPQIYPKEVKKTRCECRPGYSPLADNHGCQLPLIALAKFLNGQDYFK